MIRLRFGPGSLERVRFAVSPLMEMTGSLRALRDPDARALHLPWIREARERTAGLDLAPLMALLPEDRYTPDFIHPPPRGPLAGIEEELAVVAATPPAVVRREVERAYRGRELPAALRPLLDAPADAIPALAELARAYFDRALAPHWPRIRAVVEGDVLHRARRLADGGARLGFAGIDPSVRWADGVLRIEKPAEQDVELGERGLLFVPSVFIWPRVVVVTAPPWQPTLIYPARGAGGLWEPAGAGGEALAALLGRNRATLLTALERPRSTTDLAALAGITPGGVSQHLAVLRAAGLVRAHRVGRTVLNLRSAAGDVLVGAAREE
jgi:DNA-binding transcriptional ArsR family regulator